MVKVKTDMTGWVMKEHGQPESLLTVIERAEDKILPSGEVLAMWLCECSCEEHNKVIVSSVAVKNGRTKSCGCLHRKSSSARMREIAHQRKKYNQYDLSGEYGIGWTNNTGSAFYFDLEDYDKIKEYCWFETNTGYLQANTKSGNKVDGRGFVKLHRLVTDNKWEWVDHINRNKADNRKENLRECDRSQNGMNRDLYASNKTGVVGVYVRKRNGKYYGQIKVNHKDKFLGEFDNIEDAIRVRLEAEAKYYGEFAPQRHLFEQYGITRQNNKEK